MKQDLLEMVVARRQSMSSVSLYLQWIRIVIEVCHCQMSKTGKSILRDQVCVHHRKFVMISIALYYEIGRQGRIYVYVLKRNRNIDNFILEIAINHRKCPIIHIQLL